MDKRKGTPAMAAGIASLFLISLGVAYIVPLLARLGMYFPEVDPGNISYAMSMAFLGCIFGPLVSGALASRRIMGYKALAITGTVIFCVAAITPTFIHNFTYILVSRFFVGFSAGFMNVVANPLINAFFTGDTRAKILSVGSAVAYIGGLVMQFFVGVLGDINFWLAFLSPGVSILSVIGACFLIKEPSEEDLPPAEKSERGKLPGPVWYCSIIFFIGTVSFMPISFNYPFFVAEISDSLTLSATIQLCNTVGSICGGLCYAWFVKVFKRYTISFACFCMLVGPLIFVVAKGSIPLMVIGQFIAGFGYCSMLPAILQSIGASVKPTMVAFATAVGMAFQNVASFCGTPFINTVGNITGDPILNPILAAAVVYAVLTVFTAVVKPIPQAVIDINEKKRIKDAA